jgi:predicted regulator of Ras-like GTPase activity (Roadblock/LC7/MglB family)
MRFSFELLTSRVSSLTPKTQQDKQTDKMLRAKRLPQILSQGLCEGIYAALLLTADGALLASATSRNDGNHVDLVNWDTVDNNKQLMDGGFDDERVFCVCRLLFAVCGLQIMAAITANIWNNMEGAGNEETSNYQHKQTSVVIADLKIAIGCFAFGLLRWCVVDSASGSKVGQLSSMLMTLTEGRVAVKSTGKGYLIAVYASRDTNVGLLLARTEAVSSYFTRVFEQLNDQA